MCVGARIAMEEYMAPSTCMVGAKCTRASRNHPAHQYAQLENCFEELIRAASTLPWESVLEYIMGSEESPIMSSPIGCSGRVLEYEYAEPCLE